MGTFYSPAKKSIEYVPLGNTATDFRIVGLDTGTVRPGLEKSTYTVRRRECEELLAMLQGAGYGVSCLADIKDQATYDRVQSQFGHTHPQHCARLRYLFHAQQRFAAMLKAWREGNIELVGALFRQDGRGLRDDYQISGETPCQYSTTH